ncbi:F-box/kelch-repeat protein At3g06240-like [Papaver somniferum]|nr:F-box/kelch-repeat protein At3g06240-like [Papaver somniferum]
MDDYKLVKLLIGGKNTVVHIYTLGSNSWKCIGTIPYKFPYHSGRSGEIVSGALHWLIKTATNFKAIVSFDVAEERFQEFQLPENFLEKKESLNCNTCLADCEGYLCLLVNSDNYQFDVWVMQEYGVHKSWAKLSSITLTFVAGESFYSRNHVWSSDNSSRTLRLMCYFKNGKILFGFCGDLILYDLERETYERIRTLVGNVEKYVESLVSLNSSTYMSKLKTRGVNLKLKGKDIVSGW